MFQDWLSVSLSHLVQIRSILAELSLVKWLQNSRWRHLGFWHIVNCYSWSVLQTPFSASLSYPVQICAIMAPLRLKIWLMAELMAVQLISTRCHAIAKMTARCAPYIAYMGALKFFGSPCMATPVCPQLIFPTFLIDFCSDLSRDCAYKIWSS